MSAALELALWVKEYALSLTEGFIVERARVREGLDLAQKTIEEENDRQKGRAGDPRPAEKSLADRAFDMWMVMASSGEYRVGPSGRDVVRTARDMMTEVASPTPWPDRKAPHADGLPAPGWNPPPEDELARY